MKAEEYILRRVNALLCKFPRLKCTYQYDELCESHMVLVEPATYYDVDEALRRSTVNLTMEFIRIFPLENLFFTNKTEGLEADQEVQVFKGEWHELESENLVLHWLSEPQATTIDDDSRTFRIKTILFERQDQRSSNRIISRMGNNEGISCMTIQPNSELTFADEDEHALAS